MISQGHRDCGFLYKKVVIYYYYYYIIFKEQAHQVAQHSYPRVVWVRSLKSVSAYISSLIFMLTYLLMKANTHPIYSLGNAEVTKAHHYLLQCTI